jgi:hypothetical protein
MSVSLNTKDVISGFGSSWSKKYNGWSKAFSLPPLSLYLYMLSGNPATASAKILTHEYTAVICIEERSVTILPLEELPQKK